MVMLWHAAHRLALQGDLRCREGETDAVFFTPCHLLANLAVNARRWTWARARIVGVFGFNRGQPNQVLTPAENPVFNDYDLACGNSR